jgi:hypothetical protein
MSHQFIVKLEGTTEGALKGWDVRGRGRKEKISVPSPLKKWDSRIGGEVFQRYVPKAKWGTKATSEWHTANKVVGGLEARIGRLRVKAGSASGKRKELMLRLAGGLQGKLDWWTWERGRHPGPKSPSVVEV